MGAQETRGGAVSTAVREALGRLPTDGWRSSLTEVLPGLAEPTGADRLCVFQNLRGPDGRLWMDLLAEWDRPGTPQIFDDPHNHLHPYFPDFAGWLDELGAGRTLRVTTRLLPEDATRRTLEGEGTRSVLALPVMVAGEWWGYVCFDACTEERDWSEGDESIARALASTVTGVVALERAAEDREFNDDKFRAMVEGGPAVTYIDAADDGASTIFMSPQIEEVLGYRPEDFYAEGDLWSRLLHPEDRARAIAENVRHNETGDPFRLEYRMFARDGRIVWVHDEARMVRDERGAPRYSHGVMMDISDRKRNEEQVAFQAYHDELTGLPSRAMFEELLELSVARARRHEGAVAVLCVDLDDFRLVNDSLGHRTGDALLQAVAERLREATRETDLVARRGGDQFLLLLADLDRDDGRNDGVVRAEAVAQRIQESLGAALSLDGIDVYVSASVGISIFPNDAVDSGALQRNAEAAMYEAKKGGTGGYVLAASGGADSSAKLGFVTRLRKAVENQRWILHYQPVLELDTGRMVGVEALIRWMEPDGTMVPPGDFIPLAEELGLIEQIGDWVVREIAYQVGAWRELDIDLEVGFNLSPRQFWQPDLAKRIVHEFRIGGVDPSRMIVEVTESSAMMDPDRAQQILTELRDAGFVIAIDDFGTGYSSLSRLRRMPVDVLKIDRSFVTKVHEDRASASIVAAFLQLAEGLDMTTLAEGVETAEELAFLRAQGCKLGQGFYFSRPVPPEEIIAYSFGGIPNAMALRSV